MSEFIKLTGYNRNYAARKLRIDSKPKNEHRKHKSPDARGRPRIYGPEVMQSLSKIWAGLDYACGKRLRAGLPDLFDAMTRFGELDCDDKVKSKLLGMSASTIDRLLRSERLKLDIKGRSTTKPGTLLKSQIPVRLGNEWNDARPGFIEIDLVAHCGENTRGEYINTLDAIDIATG